MNSEFEGFLEDDYWVVKEVERGIIEKSECDIGNKNKNHVLSREQ